MKKFLRISLISSAVAALVYVGAALLMTFWPAQSSFPGMPFPVAERQPVQFEPLTFTARDGETLFARQFPAESEMTILLLHGVTSDSAALNGSARKLRQVSGAEIITLDLRGHGQSGGVAGGVDYI